MSEILEGTPEFNRGFQLNQAAMDPVLDGQVYAPAPQILEDSREGFDENGDYHTDTNSHRMMHKIIQSVVGDMDRPFGTASRDDAVWWELQAIEEENGLPEDVSFTDIYNLFRTNYNGESDD
jgi:hypothetical protein